MTITENQLLGEWRQVKPPTGREQVFLEFEANGRLTYTIEGETTAQILLTWHLAGDEIVTDQPSAPRIERTKARFTSPTRLSLHRGGEEYTYERC